MVIKQNIATELGICNGTRCTLSRIIMHPEQKPFEQTSKSGEEHLLSKQPLVIIVRIKNPKFTQFVGLERDEFPVFPCTSTFDFKYYSDGKEHSIRVSRNQFPLLPGYALTGYAAQGATFDRAILDLTTPTGRGVGNINPGDAYVLLSRMKTRSGVLILRNFNESILARKPNQDMVKEINRLQTLADQNTTNTTKYTSIRNPTTKGRKRHHSGTIISGSSSSSDTSSTTCSSTTSDHSSIFTSITSNIVSRTSTNVSLNSVPITTRPQMTQNPVQPHPLNPLHHCVGKCMVDCTYKYL
jgi:hypothetical protein